MTDIGSRARRRGPGYAWLAAGPVAAAGAIAMFIAAQPAVAATAPNLGTDDSFAVLAGTTVTNTGPSVITGDLGLSPGSAVTGFPPGTVNGAQHVADAVALQAQTDLTTAYNAAAGAPSTSSVSGDLGGRTLTAGVYTASSSIGLTGTLTLNAEGDPNAVFIFQVGSALTTASASNVALINGAQACNVFWQVGSSATLGTGSSFIGNLLALTSISVTTGDTIDGRVLARNGAVTLDTDTITASHCAITPPPTTPPPTPTPTRSTPTPTPTRSTPTPTPTRSTPTPTPTGTSPTPRPTGTSPTPKPTGTSPTPKPTGTSPRPKPTGTSPSPRPTSSTPISSTPTPTSPSPTPTSPTPGPAPIPTPVGGTFPVTG